MDDKWHRRFLDLADQIATWSKDPSTKVGAVIVRQDRTIASLGYNGFARGVSDKPTRLVNREQRLLYTTHAEINAILTAREPLRGCTLYVTPLAPCAACAKAIIQVGIAEVVTLTTGMPERWATDHQATMNMLSEAKVSVIYIEDNHENC